MNRLKILVANNQLSHWLGGLLGILLLAACQPLTAPTTTPNQPSTPVAAAEPSYTAIAYVRDQVLYIQTPTTAAVPVEDCADKSCQIYHLTWSPDGAYLLYYWHPTADNATPEIRLADQQGQVQTVTTNAAFLRPAAWSPDGSQLAYLVNTERIDETAPMGGARVLEVWTAAVNEGVLQAGQQRGEIRFGEGCGGGGRSTSAEVYEGEGGFAYGYLAGIVTWSADETMLFSNNCASRGVGRFDLATGTELEAYAGELRSLSFNAARDQWVAIDAQNQLVMGTPAALEYAPVAAQQPAELVFFGQQSGAVYYTTLTITGTQELVDELATLDPEILVSPYFDFSQPELRKLDLTSSTESVLVAKQGYAYARVAEGTDGLFFAQVEDNSRLLTALQDGTLTIDNYQELLPTVDLFWLPTAGSTPEVWLADAKQVALVP